MLKLSIIGQMFEFFTYDEICAIFLKKNRTNFVCAQNSNICPYPYYDKSPRKKQ